MIEVVSVVGLATVQDGGRPGHMHEGVPPGGALVPELLARANAAVRNAPLETAIEVLGAITVKARVRAVVGTDDGDARALREGETRTVASDPKRRVRYLALRGAIDVPYVLGGRGTLLAAGLGGHDGRPLRRGDVLPAGDAPPYDAPVGPPSDLDGPINVVLGPDLDQFESSTLKAFLACRFVIDARSDRTGTRLTGPPMVCKDDGAALSAPMVRGAIQVPPTGELIVLGPDHPTTGGYPVIATVIRDQLGVLGARPIGAPVHFTL